MATAPTIDEGLVKSILAEVQTELDSMMKSEMEKLAKARPGESTPGEGEEDSSQTDPTGDNTSAAASSPDAASASPDASSDDGSSPAGPPPDASASAPAPDGSAPMDGSAPAPGGDPAADQGPIDPAQLVAEYSKLTLEDMKLHYQALKEAIIQNMAAAGGDASASAPPPAGPPADASASAPAAPPPGPDASAPALKAEKGMAGQKPGDSATKAPDGMKDDEQANGQNPLHKSEIDSLRKELNETHEVIGGLAKALKHVIEAPLRKSVQFVADLPAPPVDVSKMSREQVRTKLADKVKEGTLSKSDKDLVIKFEMNKVKADQVAHLLK